MTYYIFYGLCMNLTVSNVPLFLRTSISSDNKSQNPCLKYFQLMCIFKCNLILIVLYSTLVSHLSWIGSNWRSLSRTFSEAVSGYTHFCYPSPLDIFNITTYWGLIFVHCVFDTIQLNKQIKFINKYRFRHKNKGGLQVALSSLCTKLSQNIQNRALPFHTYDFS